MPNRSPPALSLLAPLLLLLCVASASAQDAVGAPLPLTSKRSLLGPRLAMGWGATLLTLAPVVGVVAGAYVALDGANLLGCDDWTTGQPDPECEADDAAHDAEVRRQLPWVIAGSATLGAGGAALLVFGIVRVAKIRRARRYEALLQGTRLALAPQGAQLSVRLRF